jgi:hypothetical protein
VKVPLSPSPPELEEPDDAQLEGEAPELVLLPPADDEAFGTDAVTSQAVAMGA